MAANDHAISRVTRSKEQARDSYDRLSRWYDLLAGSSEAKLTQQGLQLLRVQPGESVLEVGCGTGRALLALAQSVGNGGEVYGFDLSPGMLRVAQSKLEQAGLAKRAQLSQGDAAALPFKACRFDAAFMGFTLELFDTPEIPVVLGECRRVLRDGGRICVVALSRRGPQGLMVQLYEWAHRTLPQYVDCRPIFVQEALQKRGFRLIEAVERRMWGLPVEIVLAERA